MRSGVRGGIWAVAALAAGVPIYLYASAPAGEVRVDGIAVPATSDARALLRAQADAWLDTPVTLDAGTFVGHATRRELGASIEVARALAAVHGSDGALASIGLASPPAEVAWRVEVDARTLRSHLDTIRARMDTQAGRHSRSRQVVSLLPALEAAQAALTRGEVYITLPTTTLELPENMLRDDGASYDAALGRYETEYRGMPAGRRDNIELAAELIDGWVLAPGDWFSFNQVVGARDVGRGFRRATEIANGELVDGIGGGICQTAGTLHAAAFLAGLPIEEQHHHSRQSGYIDLGLDAMVAWPDKDLRFRNDYPFPIRIRAQADGRVVRVELRGAETLRSVTYRTRVVSRIDRGERRILDHHLPRGTERVEREGESGLLLERIRVIRTGDEVETETANLRYPPVDRILRIGPPLE